MRTIEIDNPNNIIYPLKKEIFENRNICYHGTWNTFSNMIESKGWNINNIPYDMRDVKYICDVCENIGLNKETYYGVLNSFTLSLGRNNNQIIKYASFSPNYWISRNFVGYRGGETITHILEATQEILNYNKTGDQEYTEMIKKIQDKYEKLIQGGYGVVYAVEIEIDWVSNWKCFDKEPQTEFILKNDIPFECIKVRINYPNGVIPFRPDYDYPLPLMWALEQFTENLKNSKYKPQDSILKEYLGEI